MFFDTYPEFINNDVRSKRQNARVNAESLENRLSVYLPESLIKGKTILDLGCAIGATGHWCLSKGAEYYCGVDIQEDYTSTADHLLTSYHQKTKFDILTRDISEALRYIDDQSYDIVVATGVIYGFLDTFGITKEICRVAKEIVIVENLNTPNPNVPMIHATNIMMVNAEDLSNPVTGIAFLPSVAFMHMMAGLCGFFGDRIFPIGNTTCEEIFHTSAVTYGMELESYRYACKYTRNEVSKLQSVQDEYKRLMNATTPNFNYTN